MDAPLTLEGIRERMLAAFSLGKLTSYERETPKGEALRLLALARRDVEDWIASNGESADSIRLLALIQESLKQYASAVQTLESLAQKGWADHRDLKRLAACRV